MKMAIPSTNHMGLNSELSEDFGKCPYFTIVDIENDEIKMVRNLENPFLENASKQLPAFLSENGVNILITGEMEPSITKLFYNSGISVISNYSGRIADVIKNYIDSK